MPNILGPLQPIIPLIAAALGDGFASEQSCPFHLLTRAGRCASRTTQLPDVDTLPLCAEGVVHFECHDAKGDERYGANGGFCKDDDDKVFIGQGDADTETPKPPATLRGTPRAASGLKFSITNCAFLHINEPDEVLKGDYQMRRATPEELAYFLENRDDKKEPEL